MLTASPEPVLLSGILARAHTIKKCSFPQAQTHSDLRCFWELAIQRELLLTTIVSRQMFGEGLDLHLVGTLSQSSDPPAHQDVTQ